MMGDLLLSRKWFKPLHDLHDRNKSKDTFEVPSNQLVIIMRSCMCVCVCYFLCDQFAYQKSVTLVKHLLTLSGKYLRVGLVGVSKNV